CKGNASRPGLCLDEDTRLAADCAADFQRILASAIMNERELILGRIREALKVSAPLPGDHGNAFSSVATATPSTQARQWLPAVGESFAEQVALFGQKCAELRAEFQLLDSEGDCAKVLADLRDREQWKKIGAHKGELTEFVCGKLGLPTCNTDAGYDVADL